MQTQRFLSILAWAALTFIAFVTLSPYSLRPELTDTEPAMVVALERVGAFGVLGLLFLLSYPGRIRTVCLIVFGSSIAFELGQAYLPDRHARLIDVLEKTIGGGAGILLGVALIPMLMGSDGMFYKIDRYRFVHDVREVDREMRELAVGFLAIILFALSLVVSQKLYL
jgi:VanZ family protein